MPKKKHIPTAMPTAQKRPQIAVDVAGEKRPFAGAPTLSDSKRQLAWRVAILDVDGAWGWKGIAPAKLREILEKLRSFEGSSWAQLDRWKHHRVSVNGLAREAQQSLLTLKQDDVDELYSLRLSNKERIWGILHDNVFYLLWWDPEHTVYPSEKKHT